MLSLPSLRSAYITARDALLAERVPAGHWVGELSTSALSTATAVMALHLVNPFEHRERIDARMKWLAEHQNADGGWGDTVKSFSNISTTMLCRAALAHRRGEGLLRDGREGRGPPHVESGKAPRAARRGDPPALRQGPHLLGADPDDVRLAGLVPWRKCRGCRSRPRRCRRAGTASPGCRWSATRCRRSSPSASACTITAAPGTRSRSSLRWLTRGRTLRVLRRIQPTTGGYLEATPLTSFVVMALASIRRAARAPPSSSGARRGRAVPGELGAARRQLADRHEPRDVGDDALGERPGRGRRPGIARHEGHRFSTWLLSQQYKAAPPLHRSRPRRLGVDRFARRRAGLRRHAGGNPRRWQPRDGPCIPTTSAAIDCRGHGRPAMGSRHFRTAMAGSRPSAGVGARFRSTGVGADLTAHALRDRTGSLGTGPTGQATWTLAYLTREQRPDGSWLPLWFGNQHAHGRHQPRLRHRPRPRGVPRSWASRNRPSVNAVSVTCCRCRTPTAAGAGRRTARRASRRRRWRWRCC